MITLSTLAILLYLMYKLTKIVVRKTSGEKKTAVRFSSDRMEDISKPGGPKLYLDSIEAAQDGHFFKMSEDPHDPLGSDGPGFYI